MTEREKEIGDDQRRTKIVDLLFKEVCVISHGILINIDKDFYLDVFRKEQLDDEI